MLTLGDKVRITQAYRIQYADPIQFAAGEKIVVEREDEESPGWVWCRAADGRQGWVPIELLAQHGREAIAREAYSARELAVQPGEEVIVVDSRHKWLRVRNRQGECGWIPESTVKSP